LSFFDRQESESFLSWALDYFTGFDVKSTLMAGALENVSVFVIIKFATKVCTFTGNGPSFIVSIKKYKSCGDHKTG
jgi:hypothetical protein